MRNSQNWKFPVTERHGTHEHYRRASDPGHEKIIKEGYKAIAIRHKLGSTNTRNLKGEDMIRYLFY